MITEALKYLVGLGKPTQITHDGLVYTDRQLHRVTPPGFGMIGVTTLKGLSEAMSSGFEGLKAADLKTAVLLLVSSPTEATLIARQSDQYGRRQEYLQADCSGLLPKFAFGQFMSSESFIIALQSHFVPEAGDVDYLLNIASSLTMEAINIAEDDGFSQKTSIRRGVVLKDEARIKPRVKLAPYRTFTEVDQPVSEFVFRLKPVENGIPQCGLFEADGGKWRSAAMENVAAWLSRNNESVTVIS